MLQWPAKHPPYSNILCNIFGNRTCVGPRGRSDRRLASSRRCCQYPGCRVQWRHVGVVAWRKFPGGHDKSNPDASKQNRLTLGMPILLDMKKKAHEDGWEGQVYNAKDGKTLRLDHQAGRFRPARNQGLRARIPLRRRDLDACRTADSEQPGQQHGEGHQARRGARPEDERVRRRGSENGECTPERSGRGHLPTPRHRAVCPLARAGTTARRRAW